MRILLVLSSLFFCSVCSADLDTFTYVSSFGGDEVGAGGYEGDSAVLLPVTVLNSMGGGMGQQGVRLSFLHAGAKNALGGDYSATVRVIGQTQALDGGGGKAGLVLLSDLSGSGPMVMAQLTFGNDSQHTGSNPVPVSLAVRSDGLGSEFEVPIVASPGYTGAIDSEGFVANVIETRWLKLNYDASTNQFKAGVARDRNGVPGVWNYSELISGIDINQGSGYYYGIGYSANNDMAFEQVTRPDGLHGVTFEQHDIWGFPEPSGHVLFLSGLFGLRAFCRSPRNEISSG